MGIVLMIVIILMLVAMVTRGRTPRPNQLRRKPGEGEAEARLTLLGTYRVYSWALLAAVLLALLAPVRQWIGPWVGGLGAVVAVAVVLMSHALYWRLGYGWQRLLFAAAHLSGLFGLMECYGPLGQEVRANAFGGEPPTSK